MEHLEHIFGHLQLVTIKQTVVTLYFKLETIIALVIQATPTAPLLLLVMTISARVLQALVLQLPYLTYFTLMIHFGMVRGVSMATRAVRRTTHHGFLKHYQPPQLMMLK